MVGGGEKAVYFEVDSSASHHVARNGWAALRVLLMWLRVWCPLGSPSGSRRTLLWRLASTLSALLLLSCLSILWILRTIGEFYLFWSSATPPRTTPPWRGPTPSSITFSLCAVLERNSRVSIVTNALPLSHIPSPSLQLCTSLSLLVILSAKMLSSWWLTELPEPLHLVV